MLAKAPDNITACFAPADAPVILHVPTQAPPLVFVSAIWAILPVDIRHSPSVGRCPVTRGATQSLPISSQVVSGMLRFLDTQRRGGLAFNPSRVQMNPTAGRTMHARSGPSRTEVRPRADELRSGSNER